MRNLDFSSRNIVITGGARGIGLECAVMLAQRGAFVHVLDVSPQLMAQARERHPGIRTFEADVSNDGQIADVFAQIGRIDVLINNAGIQTENAFEDIELAEWRRTIDVNLTGTFICIQTGLKYMPNGSTILNVLTHEGRRTNLYPYAASKAAIKNLTMNLAIALSGREISINGIAFGAVYSERNKHWQHDEAQVLKAKQRTPLGIILQPEEVAAQMVAFLEHSSRYSTGMVFDISAGRSLT